LLLCVGSLIKDLLIIEWRGIFFVHLGNW